MPKILKKHEFKAKSGGFQSKYDWGLILGGQVVALEAGTDYESTGHSKDGSEFDRTDAFVTAIRARAYDNDKTVEVDKFGPGEHKDLPNGGLIVKATPMTAEQAQNRKADLERKRQERAAAKAANTSGDGSNGSPTPEPLPEASAGAALE